MPQQEKGWQAPEQGERQMSKSMTTEGRWTNSQTRDTFKSDGAEQKNFTQRRATWAKL